MSQQPPSQDPQSQPYTPYQPDDVKMVPRPGKEGGASAIHVRRSPHPADYGTAGGAAAGVHQVKDLAPLFIILAAIVVLFPLWERLKLDHGPNDASRWNAVFFLFEKGTMEWTSDWEPREWHGGKGKTPEDYPNGLPKDAIQVGEKYYTVSDLRFYGIGPFWSIDMIKVGDAYYSSKPPLLSWIVYGVVEAVSTASEVLLNNRWTFKTFDGAYYLMRTTVIVLQVVPWLFCVWLLAREFRRMTDKVFVRNFCIACAALGTYLTPWLIPLNNHVPAACSVTIAAYAGIRIWYDKKLNPLWFLLGGTFGALAFCFELPAVAFLAGIFLVMLIRSPLRTIAFAMLPALILIGAYFYTTHEVTGSYVPIPMQHWDEGGVYDYPGSYWSDNDFTDGPSGIDALDEDKPIYAMHLLIGHHGFFLLTPIFLLGLFGIIANMARDDEEARPLLALGTLLLFIVVASLYAWRTNNYGGVVQGARWLFWMIPLWLLMLPAGVRIVGRIKIGRAVCYLLLAVSLISVWWALPQVSDVAPNEPEVHRPFSNSWAHEMFRENWMPDALEIEY